MNMMYQPQPQTRATLAMSGNRFVARTRAKLHAVGAQLPDLRNMSPVYRQRLAMFAIIAMTFAVAQASQAQSIDIDFGPEDMDTFFSWFNTMFGVLLPIALIGAGIVAGGAFVWVVAGMLQRAFTSILGRNRV